MAGVLLRSFSLRSATCSSFLFRPNISKSQVSGLISKAMRDDDYKRPLPFPYKEKVYSAFISIFDQTTWRFDENSKIIVVDGPVASGKSKLAKKIAEEFDLFFIPHPNMDPFYINKYGYDLRTLDDKIPFSMKKYEPQDFHANPYDIRSPRLQMSFFQLRLSQYLDAMTHVMSTGQGVVLVRSVYSDFVFMETHVKFGFHSPGLKPHYELVWNCIRPDLMKPHLIIYIDTPVEVIRENLAKRNDPVLLKSPALQPEVLKECEELYKQKFLKQISTHAELLVYDGSKDVDPEIVVEDMERVNLDDFEFQSEKMKDWRFLTHEDEWADKRIECTKKRSELEAWVVNVPPFQCPELAISADDTYQYEEVKKTLPGNKYAYGYNSDLGDTNILFKR